MTSAAFAGSTSYRSSRWTRQGLLAVAVTVREDKDVSEKPVSFALVRWMIDPQTECDLEAAAARRRRIVQQFGLGILVCRFVQQCDRNAVLRVGNGRCAMSHGGCLCQQRSCHTRRGTTSRATPTVALRPGLTLLELMLALTLTAIVLVAISMAIDLHLRVLQSRRDHVERIQLARAVLGVIATDLRSTVQQNTTDFSALASMASAALSSGAVDAALEAATGDDGSGGTGETSGGTGGTSGGTGGTGGTSGGTGGTSSGKSGTSGGTGGTSSGKSGTSGGTSGGTGSAGTGSATGMGTGGSTGSTAGAATGGTGTEAGPPVARRRILPRPARCRRFPVSTETSTNCRWMSAACRAWMNSSGWSATVSIMLCRISRAT